MMLNNQEEVEAANSAKVANCDVESEVSEPFPLFSPQARCTMDEATPSDGWTPSTSSSLKLGTSQYWATALPTPRPSSPTPSTASPTSSVLAPGSLCLGSMTSLLPGPNSELFMTPCPPMVVSGGSATFYHVRYKPQFTGEELRMDYFVGKDLSRAPHEVEFYAHLSRERDLDPAWDLFSEVCMYCGGVLSLPCSLNSRTPTTKTLLLLENMNSGFSKLRLCDIKIGQETAKAGWKGKSRVGAFGNRMVDGVTNSIAEGLRLEGMDRPPSSLQRRLDAHIDVSARSSWWKRICVTAVGGERAQRFSSQRLQMREVLQYWLDLSDQGLGYERAVHENVWAILPKVTNLLRSLVRIPWPQVWIGSSIGLGLEARATPGPKRVVAKFFDWGRSDLVNEERYMKLTEDEREEYIKSWHVFVASCCRLHWELSRVALHRCCAREWKSIVVEVLGESTAFLGAVVAGSSGIANKSSSLFAIAKLDIQHIQAYSGKVIGHQLFGPGSGASPIGCVDIKIDFLQEADKESPLTTRVEVGKAKLQLPDLSHTVVLVQVVAFEDPDDATQHFKHRQAGAEAPLPKEKASSQILPPGKKVRDGMVWSEGVEFTELGSHVRDAEERLKFDLSEAFLESESVERRSSWMELLEPPYIKSTNSKALAQQWGAKFVWWLKPGERYPDHWLAARPYQRDDAVEIFSPDAQVWLPGTVVEADLVAVEYSDDEGNPTPIFVPSCDQTLRPKFTSRDDLDDRSTYEVYDDVEVYVPALNGWFDGSVLGVNFVSVVFTDLDGRMRRKQLPSKNALLRRPPPPAKSGLEALLEDNANLECEDVETFIESDNDDEPIADR